MATLRATGIRRLTALFHEARDPIFILAPNGDFTYVNPAWEALSGLTADTVVGRNCTTIERELGLSGPLGFWPTAEALAGEASATQSLITRPDGERVWRRVEFWPFRDGQNTDLGILGCTREVDSGRRPTDSPSRRYAIELDEAREAIRRRFGDVALVGAGPRHARLLQQISAASKLTTPVLIVGEVGTGRRTAARLIHQQSSQSQAGLMTTDVAALGNNAPSVLTDVDLGTILLLGPEHMTRDVQEKLVLRLAESPLRLICVSELDPETALREGRYREDFYFAITPLVIRIAPLRERLEEMPILAAYFLEQVNRRGDGMRRDLAPDAVEMLSLYDWPGNLGELSRVIEAAHGRAASGMIHSADLPAEIKGEFAAAHSPPMLPGANTPLDHWLTLLERRMIEAAMARARQNKSRAAEILEISRPRLYRRIKELGIPDDGDNGDGRPA